MPGNFPKFQGVLGIVELVDRLCGRPTGRRTNRADQTNSAVAGLPIVCLVLGEPDSDSEARNNPLPALTTRLAEAAPYRVPHTYRLLGSAVDPDADSKELTHRDVLQVRGLLHVIAHELSASVNARWGRLRFDRLALIHWIMDQDLTKSSHSRPDQVLLDRLRKRDSTWRADRTLGSFGELAPESAWWAGWIISLLRLVLRLWFRLRTPGRLPFLSGIYRWPLRQPHLSPNIPGGFLGFAERLSKTEYEKEDPEQLALLLTNAFLEDLRQTYRWRLWQLRRQRRPTYPVVLLDDINPGNGGYTLIRLINDVRNEMGMFDPLLLITASRALPPDETNIGSLTGSIKRQRRGRTVLPDRMVYSAQNAVIGYRAWQQRLEDDLRARRDTAWYLPISVAAAEIDASDVGQKLNALGPYRTPRRPWWSLRWVRFTGVLAVLAGCATGYHIWAHAHCGGWTRWPGWPPTLNWKSETQECIGVTDGSYPILQYPGDGSLDPSIQAVLHTIVDQNQQAEVEHENDPGRIYVALASLEAFTSADGTPSGLTAERESLEGLAVAQNQSFKPHSRDPLLRIEIANAGQQMRYGPEVATQLGELAAREPGQDEPRLVGVVGLNHSSKVTQQTIDALTHAGLPVVSAPLSEDGLANNAIYYQVAPQNRREVAIAVAFGKHLLELPGYASVNKQKARIYYSADDSDTYSTGLGADLMKALNPQGTNGNVETSRFPPDGGYDAGHSACGYDGVVYYAGRGLPAFHEFIEGMAERCANSPPLLIADDDVSHYVADEETRIHNNIPFYYMSFAVTPDPTLELPSESDFYFTLDQLFHSIEQTKSGGSLDGHAAMTYDAALTMSHAVQYLESTHIPVLPTTVWHALDEVRGSYAVEGATGNIDFGDQIDRHFPVNKPVFVLKVTNDQVGITLPVSGGLPSPTQIEFCGIRGKLPQSPWCPPGD